MSSSTVTPGRTRLRPTMIENRKSSNISKFTPKYILFFPNKNLSKNRKFGEKPKI